MTNTELNHIISLPQTLRKRWAGLTALTTEEEREEILAVLKGGHELCVLQTVNRR